MLKMQVLPPSNVSPLLNYCKAGFVIVSDFFILIKANTHGGVLGETLGQRTLDGG